MPAQRHYRKFSNKQKIALQNRKKPQLSLFNHSRLCRKPAQADTCRRLTTEQRFRLNDLMDSYDARLIELEHKYPIGQVERFEWFAAHRKVWAERLIKLLGREG
jgi:hypothetical protein